MSAEQPTVLAVHAAVICSCGNRNDFDQLEPGWSYDEECDDCGREIQLEVEVEAVFKGSAA